MPPETTSELSESDVTSTIFKETELTLGLPGEARSPAPSPTGGRTCTKRGFIETVDLNLGSSTSKPRGKTLADEDDKSENIVTGAGKAPAAK
jgi:auxin-responsive protein IAA